MSNLSLFMPVKKPFSVRTPPYFSVALAALCLLYFGIECYYITHSIFSVDDFWLAYHTYHYKTGLPYRDFSPYKTVLGYYLMLLPMLITYGTIPTLIAVKIFMAMLNTVALALAGGWLKKFFSADAVLFALALLAFAFCFLAFSTEIRVDLLAYWFCFFSFLLLWEEKYWLAGLCIGTAFLISQKSLWCLLAMDCALVVSLNFRSVRPLLQLNGMAIALVGLYILFWSYFATLPSVLENIFYDAYLIAHLTDYQSAIGNFWKTTLTENLILFTGGVFGLLSLFVPPQNLSPSRRLLIAIYTIVLAVFFITYQQPFSYHLLVLMPALLILSVALCEWIFAVFTYPLARVVFCVGMLLGNISFTSVSYLLTVADNQYQFSMLTLMQELLQQDENYIAGAPLIFNKPAIIPGLTHLTVPQLNYLYKPKNDARKFMLASLYLDPVSQKEVLTALQSAPIKFYVNNNRIQALPPALKTFLANEYQHFWGSIYLYAPTINAGRERIFLKFAGRYEIVGTRAVKIDGKDYPAGAVILFHKGNHDSMATAVYRLRLLADMVRPSSYYDDIYWKMIG